MSNDGALIVKNVNGTTKYSATYTNSYNKGTSDITDKCNKRIPDLVNCLVAIYTAATNYSSCSSEVYNASFDVVVISNGSTNQLGYVNRHTFNSSDIPGYSPVSHASMGANSDGSVYLKGNSIGATLLMYNSTNRLVLVK